MNQAAAKKIPKNSQAKPGDTTQSRQADAPCPLDTTGPYGCRRWCGTSALITAQAGRRQAMLPGACYRIPSARRRNGLSARGNGAAAAFLRGHVVSEEDELATELHGGQRQVGCQQTAREQGGTPAEHDRRDP